MRLYKFVREWQIKCETLKIQLIVMSDLTKKKYPPWLRYCMDKRCIFTDGWIKVRLFSAIIKIKKNVKNFPYIFPFFHLLFLFSQL